MPLADTVILQLDLLQTMALVGSILGGLPTAAFFIGKAVGAALKSYLERKDELDRARLELHDDQIKAMGDAIREQSAGSRQDREKMAQTLVSMEDRRQIESRTVVDSLVELNKEAIAAVVSMTTKIQILDSKLDAITRGVAIALEPRNRRRGAGGDVEKAGPDNPERPT